MNLPADFKEFIELVNLENVRYLVIGGWAVNRFIEPRFTGDIDFFIDNNAETEQKIRQVLVKFGFGDAIPDQSESLFQKPVIMLGRPPNQIDILTQADGITFAEIWARREIENIDGLDVSFISLPDLIANKQASGRDKDLVDLKFLTDLLNRRDE